ncbi:hypothetical protein CDL15_Pgr015720 [Punica granatum]|uniref:CRC domain-containing protein n=1 Tax=Punica granatum TaxID=22663 RepID=A0A218XP32_PUNGR|nr:hypothetical protein CDL15_Pgr015720 [Punica granatum]
MDSHSPGGNAKTTGKTESANFASSCSDSPPVQESPYSNFLNNLSPLELKKAAAVPQGFIGINSPPLVFTSPRITLPRDAHILKRPQVLQLSTEESPQHNVRAKSPQDKKSEPVLVTDNDEDFVVKDFAEAQPSNSPICVDGFLVDPFMVDCANSTCSVDAHGKEVDSGSPSDITPLQFITSDHEQNHDADEHIGNALDSGAPLEKSKYVMKKMEIKEKLHDGERSPNLSSNVISDKSGLQFALFLYIDQDTKMQGAGGSNEDKFDNATNSISESFSTTHAYQDCDNNAGASASYFASTHNSEIIPTQRGLLRRCLFDEARPDISSTRSGSYSSNIMSSVLSATSAKLEGLNLTRANSSAVSIKNKVQELSKPIDANVPPRTGANFPLIASRPLGIGLHLNSVVSGKKIGHIATSSAEPTVHHLIIQGTKSTLFETCHVLDSTKSCLRVETVQSSNEGSKDDSDASIIHSTPTSESPHDSGGQNPLMPLEHSADTSAKRKLSSEHAESQDPNDQMSPMKRRQKESVTSTSDGCKRCNCRKSKCLKLYCECFAAGLYCSEPCACQGCFNRPEYQDKVNYTRKQIESRNPSAFAPKIVESANQFLENDVVESPCIIVAFTKANVGCSDNCRCEGCKNVYGTKQGYGLSKPLLSNRVSDGISGEEKFEVLAADDGSFLMDLHNPHSLTPMTPAFEFSDHGKGPPKSRLPLPKILSSPGSDITTLLSVESKHSGDADSSIMQISSAGTLESGMNNCITERSCREMVDGFSPRRDSLLNLSHLTPRLAHPVVTSSSSSSSSSSKARNSISTRGSRIVLVSKSGQEPSSSRTSLQGRISPITPITDVLLNNKSGKDLNSSTRHSGVSEDDTPEILKEASTPTKSINVSSPNRKRVSPPHSWARSSSSVCLKSGRKFILKAVPSFPPLTPCIDRGGSKNSNITDIQDDSRDK